MSNEPPLPSDGEPEKLVLPPPPDTSLPDDTNADDMHTLVAPYAGRNTYQAAIPPKSSTPDGQQQRDSAYRFLLIGIILLIITGLVTAILLSNTFVHLPTLFGAGQPGTPQSNTGASTQGTIDAHPFFPTPGGGHSSTQTSQPPTSGIPTILPTPAPSPTAPPTPGSTSTPAPTSTPGQGGALTVQIVGPPSTAGNNSTILINVSTNQPAVTVQLFVLYNAPPYRYVSSLQTTDSNGYAALPWSIHVIARGLPVTATLSVVARSQNGQSMISQTVLVQIIGAVGGMTCMWGVCAWQHWLPKNRAALLDLPR